MRLFFDIVIKYVRASVIATFTDDTNNWSTDSSRNIMMT